MQMKGLEITQHYWHKKNEKKNMKIKSLERRLRKEDNIEVYTKNINSEGVNVIQIAQWRFLFS